MVLQKHLHPKHTQTPQCKSSGACAPPTPAASIATHMHNVPVCHDDSSFPNTEYKHVPLSSVEGLINICPSTLKHTEQRWCVTSPQGDGGRFKWQTVTHLTFRTSYCKCWFKHRTHSNIYSVIPWNQKQLTSCQETHGQKGSEILETLKPEMTRWSEGSSVTHSSRLNQ